MTQDTAKAHILAALDRWIRQRPGLEFGNYGDRAAYAAEMRSITRDGAEAKKLLEAVARRSGITGADLAAAFERAFSGRLSWDGKRLDYTTGQYWPTEYRKAAAAVLASALWTYFRANMPESSGMMTVSTGSGPFRSEYQIESYGGVSAGDWLRRTARREFGRGIASRWFN